MKLRVKVKAKHIRETRESDKYYNAFSCPVARALQEACPNYEFGVFTWGDRRIGIRSKIDGVEVYSMPQPESVRRFVQFFDEHLYHAALPFQFTLEVPDEIMCND